MQSETGRSAAVQIAPRQRWSIALSYLLIIAGLLIGLNQRDRALNRSSEYSNFEAGITARYPARWLLDESPDTIFRARDMSLPGFKTEIQLSSLPIGADSAERNIFDRLSMRRAQVLIDYSVLGYGSYTLADDSQALTMAYSYVARDASPFLAGSPAIVRGLDILTLRRGQALVISFRADTAVYDEELGTLSRFMETLQF